MSGQLIARSPDLRRLAEEGYELEVREDGALLLAHHVPYVNPACEIKYGTIVSTLALAGDTTTTPETHTAHFIGETPCDERGQILTGVLHSSVRQKLADGVEVDHLFSSKPSPTTERPGGGYHDYYDKLTSYINILASPAQALDHSASAQTFQGGRESDGGSVFMYAENASIRAGIGIASQRLKLAKVAIVGLGGTGAYILDLVAKIPIEQIHLFDGDAFLQHNAFRSPGAASIEELRQLPPKVLYLRDRYAPMHGGIITHEQMVTADNVGELDDMDFVFVAIDHGPSRKVIVEHLEAREMSFIDVGMGLGVTAEDSIEGLIRVTTSTPRCRKHVWDSAQVPFGDPDPDNLYDRNIQVADMNMLNAVLAVIKFKKLVRFYADLGGETSTFYGIDLNDLVNESPDE